MRGRVGIGAGSGPSIGGRPALTPRNLGDISGAETHKLVVDEMPSHDHTGRTGSTQSALADPTDAGTTGGHDIADNGSHSHSIPLQGNDQPHNNMQPFLVLRYLIKY